MKRILISIGLALFIMATTGLSQEKDTTAKPNLTDKTVEQPEKKEDLYNRWEKIKKDRPAEAYQIATTYQKAFPNDESAMAKVMKAWLSDYEKTLTEMATKSNGATSAAPSSSADVAGKWLIIVSTNQGDLQFTLTLTQDGKKLLGSVDSIYGKGKIKSGEIVGSVITLDIDADPLEVKLKGTLEDKRIKGIVNGNGPGLSDLPFVGTRPK